MIAFKESYMTLTFDLIEEGNLRNVLELWIFDIGDDDLPSFASSPTLTLPSEMTGCSDV